MWTATARRDSNSRTSAWSPAMQKSRLSAAASIIAKVTRDRLMRQFAEQYPQYGFEKHKGYETKAHDEALLEHGPCPIHRMTFLKKFYEQHPDAPR